MKKKIITLTTDFGEDSFYEALLKGKLMTALPTATITSITNNITKFDIRETAFVLRSSYKFFPEGTIHIIGVQTEVSDTIPLVAMLYDKHYFICADNGILSLISCGKQNKIFKLNTLFNATNNFLSFIESTSAFASAISNDNIENIASTISSFGSEFIDLSPTIIDNELHGQVIYIDSYNNAVVNITQETFQNFVGDKKFFINVKSRNAQIDVISKTYTDIGSKNDFEGKLLAIFGCHGYLEIAMCYSNVSQLLGIEKGSPVTVSLL
ncbi:MAG: SAM-dependent chlorinase/fluorinase [Bacteroidales bacterium]|nr:SAM-dependent chlorinase/fluorinase [Bacteroidales bacterium]